MEEENKDNLEELGSTGVATVAEAADSSDQCRSAPIGSFIEQECFKAVNGMGSTAARYFELSIYGLIFATIAIGVYQTMDGHDNDFHEVEWVAVVVFTVEYILRLIGTGADPQFSKGNNPIGSRLRFMVSFYSIVDIMAIVPFYIVWALPNSIINEYDEYLRMIRIIRLVKVRTVCSLRILFQLHLNLPPKIDS